MADLSAVVSQEYKKYSALEQTKVGDDLLLGYFKKPLIFTNPPMTDVAFRLINDTYKGLCAAADKNDEDAINARNKYYRITWLPAVNSIRIDVNKVAAGDKALVDLSGFHSTKVVSTKKVKGDKIAVDAEPKTSGSRAIGYSTKTKMKASAILVTVTPMEVVVTVTENVVVFEIPASDKPTFITQVLGTAKKGEVGGLERKLEVKVGMLSVNGAGCSPASNEVSVIVP